MMVIDQVCQPKDREIEPQSDQKWWKKLMHIPGVQKSEGIKFHHCSNKIQLSGAGIHFWNEWNLTKYMRGISFSKIRAGLRAGYQLWGSSSEKADIHRKNNYCVLEILHDSWSVIFKIRLVLERSEILWSMVILPIVATL
jgi:hypothetical protein